MSAAMLEVTAGSMPKVCSPINASPDSFSRMRLYMGAGDDEGMTGIIRHTQSRQSAVNNPSPKLGLPTSATTATGL